MNETAPDTARPVIPVYRPDLSGNERRYVLDCIESSWISSNGAYIARFEAAFASAVGAVHAYGVCNGTVALHALGIGPGDEVIVPSFTYIASVNTIVQCGATPVFADSRDGDWLLDPADVEARITPRTRAIMPVHLYGAACDMDAIMALARPRGIAVLEDCAEAFTTTIHGRHVGTFGDAGMVICNDEALGRRMLQARGQGQSFTRRYWHEVMGFNYRMTNIVAAIGLAQIERLEAIVAAKRQVSARYRALLAGLKVTFQRPGNGVDGPEWLVSLLLPEGTDRDRLMARMAAGAVETRPVFYPAHTMPMYARGERFPRAEAISARGLSLPSYPTLTESELARVAEALTDALREQGLA